MVWRRSILLSPRRGAMLLEVVLALAILVASLAAIGIQINSGLRVGYDNEVRTQALMLAEAKIGQLDTGRLVLENGFDAFGVTFPGYFWRFEFEPYDDVTPGMFMVRLDILYDGNAEIVQPGEATASDLEDARLVLNLHTLRPIPPTLDLQRDFGFTEDQMDEIAAKLPPEIADPTNISPAALAEMDLETLMEFAPMIMELLGPGFGFDQGQLDAMIESGVDPGALLQGSDVEGAADDLLQRAGPGAGRGAGGGGRGGGADKGGR